MTKGGVCWALEAVQGNFARGFGTAMTYGRRENRRVIVQAVAAAKVQPTFVGLGKDIHATRVHDRVWRQLGLPQDRTEQPMPERLERLTVGCRPPWAGKARARRTSTTARGAIWVGRPVPRSLWDSVCAPP